MGPLANSDAIPGREAAAVSKLVEESRDVTASSTQRIQPVRVDGGGDEVEERVERPQEAPSSEEAVSIEPPPEPANADDQGQVESDDDQSEQAGKGRNECDRQEPQEVDKEEGECDQEELVQEEEGEEEKERVEDDSEVEQDGDTQKILEDVGHRQDSPSQTHEDQVDPGSEQHVKERSQPDRTNLTAIVERRESEVPVVLGQGSILPQFDLASESAQDLGAQPVNKKQKWSHATDQPVVTLTRSGVGRRSQNPRELPVSTPEHCEVSRKLKPQGSCPGEEARML